MRRRHHFSLCVPSTSASISLYNPSWWNPWGSRNTTVSILSLKMSLVWLSAPTAPAVLKYKITHFVRPTTSGCCADTCGCSKKDPQLWCMPWYFTHPHSQIYLLSLSLFSHRLCLSLAPSVLLYLFILSARLCVPLSPCLTLNLRRCQQRCNPSFTSHPHAGSMICWCTCLTRKKIGSKYSS